jgi:hypothetical protein
MPSSLFLLPFYPGTCPHLRFSCRDPALHQRVKRSLATVFGMPYDGVRPLLRILQLRRPDVEAFACETIIIPKRKSFTRFQTFLGQIN